VNTAKLFAAVLQRLEYKAGPVQARVSPAFFWRHLSKFMSEFHGVSRRFGRMFGRSPTIATFFPRLK
jgi:hypothetical protein